MFWRPVATSMWDDQFVKIDLATIRKMAIISVFSDDLLMETLVLKGGNAVDLIHGYGERSSIDIDFSMEADFENVDDAAKRLSRALRKTFDEAGFTLFDEEFTQKPNSRSNQSEDFWGGYEIKFKLLEHGKTNIISTDLDSAGRNALVVSPNQVRTFKMQISKFEYCKPKIRAELDGFQLYIYTPAMIVLEKVRALCQQMPEYKLIRHKRPRARDFYDIYSIVSEGSLEIGTPEGLELARCIFEAKKVPLYFIPRIEEYRNFHKQDWGSVRDSVSGDLYEFDYYFDFVLAQVQHLKPLWVK
ncbi:MAG TPA: nucleotidyl transferase AbiEii/AbiGii toxin family protein [Terriglobia bacterium]|nr:nucleotidyl transferase AbiEii/AbiGii toxin family protein [Terriglobia bacterium]